MAVAVSPRASYARVRIDDDHFVLGSDRVGPVLGEQAEIVEQFTGEELVARYGGYEGPIFAATDREPGPLPILADDFVTTEDGTGIVHLAPAFGEDDYRVAAAAGIFRGDEPRTLYNPVKPDGTYDGRVLSREGRPFEGRFVKDPQLTKELIADLDERGLLLRVQEYEHSYPHCWRCGTPLLYYAKPSWYIATTKLREELLAANETVEWYPPHVKHGRFGDWLANNVDWALSRERYWGTPLPVWRCERGHVHVIGSFEELQERSGRELADHHRPFVDDVEFACPHEDADGEPDCGQPMKRVPEVIDVWFDSGAMPFAQHHPFEHAERFGERYPADFICEAQDQTRGWFYSLLAVATLLSEPPPYRNVVCLGLILDEEGQKMSKSKGNTVEPWQVLDTYGADAFRWYFFTSKQPWDGYRFSAETIGEGVRLFLKQLWSTYFFYSLYARASADQLSETRPAGEPSEELDRWALSRTAGTAELVAERLDAYDATTAGRAIAELVEELSNWYVRRSRRRFWDGDPAAFATLRTCLVTVSKLLAPFCPFMADEIYDNLDGTLASVHLCDFPQGRRSRRGRAPCARGGAGARHVARARDGPPGAGRAGQGQDQGAPAAGRGDRRRGGPRAGGDRAAVGDRARGAERQARALRGGRRGAGQLRAEGQLPQAGSDLRKHDAPGRRCDRRTRSGARGGRATRRRRRWRGRHHGRRARAHAVGRGRDPDDARARGLQRRARGRARGRAGPGDRRRAARGGPGARDRSTRSLQDVPTGAAHLASIFRAR